MSFVAEIKRRLLTETSVYDLSRNQAFSSFYFIGFKETPVSLDFVTFVEADDLTECEIVDLRDRFFAAIQAVSYEFGLRPGARNPNGLLAFVFQSGCSEAIASFVQKQSKANSFQKSAVMVSWGIDVPAQKIYTHRNLVSIVPPIFIVAQTVFPGLRLLNRVLAEYQQSDWSSQHETVLADSASSKTQVNKLGSDFASQLNAMQATINEIFHRLSNMPTSKYNFSGAQKVQIFEKVETYIENQASPDQSQFQQTLEALQQEIAALQQRHPQVTSDTEAFDIVEAEFTEIARTQPQKLRQLLELKRWLKGAKSGGISLAEHIAEESIWGKTLIGFLDGFTDEG